MFIIKDVLTKPMRIKFLFLLLILAFNVSCVKDPVEVLIEEGLNNIKPKTEKPLIIALGDSLTRGFDYKIEQAYPHLLEKRLNSQGCDYEVLNFGVNNEVSEKAIGKLDIPLKLENIEIFIIELGANDIAKKTSVAEIKENLQQIIEQVKRKKIKILLCGYQAPKSLGKEYRDEVAKMYRELAKENDLELLPDFMSGVQDNSQFMLKDNVHPNEKGIKIIEKNVFEGLKPLLNCKK